MNGPLLDATVLIAACFPEHEHFEVADRWLAQQPDFAVCPITEGALARFAMRLGLTGRTTGELLAGLRDSPGCVFVADDVSYRDVELDGLRGHRQVTDAYLLRLAQWHGRRLATFDRALAESSSGSTVVPA